MKHSSNTRLSESCPPNRLNITNGIAFNARACLLPSATGPLMDGMMGIVVKRKEIADEKGGGWCEWGLFFTLALFGRVLDT